jgi:hypothetical protein
LEDAPHESAARVGGGMDRAKIDIESALGVPMPAGELVADRRV